MCELQNMKCTILVILHIGKMLLHLPLKLALYDIKMNGKISAIHLLFLVLYI